MLMDEKKIFKTSIPKLDDYLDGGLRESSMTLLWSFPGIDNSPFAYQAMVEQLENGGRCIYINQSKMSNAILNEIEHYGWNIKPYLDDGSLVFLDAYSGLINAESKDAFSVKNPRNPDEITKELKKMLDPNDGRDTMVVYDSISTLIDHCGDDAVYKMQNWKDILEKNKAVGLFLFTEWPYDDKILEELKKVSDAVVELRAIEEKVILREFFVVSKVGWNGKIRKGATAPFKITVPGGVMIYIPKILVTGPFNAGKSSLIHSLSDTAVSVERVGTTVALDHGHVDYAGFSVDLFGTPGQERFDPILEMLGGEALGVIAVVDSTNPDSFPRVKEMLTKTKSAGLPCIIAANKNDLPGALSVEEIRNGLGLDIPTPVLPITATDLSMVEKDKPANLKEKDLYALLDALFSKIV